MHYPSRGRRIKIEGSVALVTGANGGIGQVIVRELLRRGAKKVYATARRVETLTELIQAGEGRVIPLKLDLTDESAIREIGEQIADLTLLINNAGTSMQSKCIGNITLLAARLEFEVNTFGPLSLIRRCAPVLRKNGGGCIVNILSFLSLVTLPALGTYSASKAAALSITRSVRAELKSQGTIVIASMPVQVNTRMGLFLPEPRLQPTDVSRDTLDAIENGTEEVYPGVLSRQAAHAYFQDPQGVQLQFLNLIDL